MRKEWKELDAMQEEIGKWRAKFSVWVIVKDGRKRGVITSRRGYHGNTSYITVEMSPDKKACGHWVKGYERVQGSLHETCTSKGIAKILRRNVEELRTYYGLEIPANERLLAEKHYWEMYMSQANYDVIRVI